MVPTRSARPLSPSTSLVMKSRSLDHLVGPSAHSGTASSPASRNPRRFIEVAMGR
jgi:hypothetical protein